MLKKTTLEIKLLSALYSISKVVAYSPSLDNLIKETAIAIENNFLAKRISFILFDSVKKEFKFIYGRGISKQVLKNGEITIHDNVLSEVSKQKSGIFCNNIQTDKRFGINKKLRYQTVSFLCVPLIHKDSVVGFISITEKENGHHFDENDLKFMQSIASEFIKGYKFIELKKHQH